MIVWSCYENLMRLEWYEWNHASNCCVLLFFWSPWSCFLIKLSPAAFFSSSQFWWSSFLVYSTGEKRAILYYHGCQVELPQNVSKVSSRCLDLKVPVIIYERRNNGTLLFDIIVGINFRSMVEFRMAVWYYSIKNSVQRH